MLHAVGDVISGVGFGIAAADNIGYWISGAWTVSV